MHFQDFQLKFFSFRSIWMDSSMPNWMTANDQLRLASFFHIRTAKIMVIAKKGKMKKKIVSRQSGTKIDQITIETERERTVMVHMQWKF